MSRPHLQTPVATVGECARPKEKKPMNNPPAAASSELILSNLFSEKGAVLPEGLPFDRWAQLVEFVGRANKASLWWWGDLLNYGERAYGEKYAQAVDESDYTYGVLRNAKYVAARIELSRRRDNLPWSHHFEVAALSPKQADEILRLADTPNKDGKRWTQAQVREAVRKAKGKSVAAPKPQSIVPERERPEEEYTERDRELDELRGAVEALNTQNDELRVAVAAQTAPEGLDGMTVFPEMQARIRALEAENAALKTRRDGLMNELAAAKRQIQTLRAKLDKALAA